MYLSHSANRGVGTFTLFFVRLLYLFVYLFSLACQQYLRSASFVSKIFVSIFYFEEGDRVIYEITDRFQKPEFLLHKNIQDVFVKLCNQNSYN